MLLWFCFSESSIFNFSVIWVIIFWRVRNFWTTVKQKLIVKQNHIVQNPLKSEMWYYLVWAQSERPMDKTYIVWFGFQKHNLNVEKTAR